MGNYSPILIYAKVIRTAPEPVLKTVGTVMNRMGIDTSLWRLEINKVAKHISLATLFPDLFSLNLGAIYNVASAYQP